MDHIVYLALGTNLGNKTKNLGNAIDALSEKVRVEIVSPIFETPPWGVVDQPAFFNQALRGTTSLSPGELLSFIKNIEKELGRETAVRYGPRLIDIDILFFNNETVDEPGLTIPHPRLQERGFVLAPLVEIAPNLCHPILDQTISTLYKKVDTTGIEKVECM